MKHLLLIFLLFAFLQNSIVCQVINEIIFLPHSDSLVTSDLRKLHPYLNHKNLILIGEANHGSHEFFKVKEAFIKYLVEELGLQNVVIEANFANCVKINDYITWQEEGTPEDLAKSVYVWPYRTEEFTNLIIWLREFNQNKEQEEVVRLWGMDMQQAYSALKILQKELANFTGKDVLTIPEFEDRMDEIKYTTNDSVLNVLSKMVDSISSERKILLQRCVEIAKMQRNFFNLYQKGSESIGQYRDSCMAENVKWVYEGLKENSKILIWAHNSHIQKINKSSMRKSSMGHYIRKWYGDKSYYIGFDFNNGTFIYPHPRERLMTVHEDERHYVARLLDEKDYHLCFIPFTEANQQFFIDPVGMRYNMGLIREKYTDLYDALFFINEVTPTKVLIK